MMVMSYCYYYYSLAVAVVAVVHEHNLIVRDIVFVAVRVDEFDSLTSPGKSIFERARQHSILVEE